MANLDPVTPGNPDPVAVAEPVTPVAAPVSEPMVPTMTWKDKLGADLRGSPLMGKFEDTAEGLNAAFESHANLEQLLGHEKVPIPQGPEDVEGWNRFSKAMGIPDAAENYGLADAQLPESMAGITIDKNKFADIVHAHKLTPAQAKGLWDSYQAINVDTYQKAQQALDSQLTDTVNKLKGEWGDAYDANVEMGQLVINKFGADQEAVDFITATLVKDPRGVKFLAKIGEQFAENKIGEFVTKRFSLAPEEAQNEIDKMSKDMEGPYMNQSGNHTPQEHDAAVARVNMLRDSINKLRG